jgi:lipid-binding SYLF domain-containing protein
MHSAMKFEHDGEAERDEVFVAALRREGLELLATVTLEEIERRMFGAMPVLPRRWPVPQTRRKPMRSMKVIVTLVIAAALAATPAFARHGMKKSDHRVLEEAVAVLEQLTTTPDDAIPESLLRNAECVMVFPHVTKGAFIVGGRYGRGVTLCRNGGNDFGAPAFFSMGGPSIGWQWGGQQTDYVLLVMNKKGMENLLEDRFSIGGNASAAAGPVGRSTEAATDAQLQAEILSWSRSQGLFAGVSLEGAVIQPSEKANARLYDRDVTARAILKGEVSPVPAAAKEFVALTRRVADRAETASNR